MCFEQRSTLLLPTDIIEQRLLSILHGKLAFTPAHENAFLLISNSSDEPLEAD
ncbi:MAG: hypothetical protein M3367_14965 [Acidobacteriota bacterium]|nr:hypothetical protein [Acidobacteriota bacterium]